MQIHLNGKHMAQNWKSTKLFPRSINWRFHRRIILNLIMRLVGIFNCLNGKFWWEFPTYLLFGVLFSFFSIRSEYPFNFKFRIYVGNWDNSLSNSFFFFFLLDDFVSLVNCLSQITRVDDSKARSVLFSIFVSFWRNEMNS